MLRLLLISSFFNFFLLSTCFLYTKTLKQELEAKSKQIRVLKQSLEYQKSQTLKLLQELRQCNQAISSLLVIGTRHYLSFDEETIAKKPVSMAASLFNWTFSKLCTENSNNTSQRQSKLREPNTVTKAFSSASENLH